MNDKKQKKEEIKIVEGPLPPVQEIKEVPFYRYFEITTKLTIVQ